MIQLVNAFVAALLGFYVGRFMGMTVHYLPEILFEGCDKGREPRDIIAWFFAKPLKGSLKDLIGRRVLYFQVGIAVLWGLTALIFPLNLPLLFVLVVSCLLICCFVTDYEHRILPDQFTLGLIWIGLAGSLFPVFVSPSEAILGAISGYWIFWAFNTIYRYFRGFEGMYPGDFKLNAGIGACVGVQSLIPILGTSFLLLIIVSIIKALINRDIKILHSEFPYACSSTIITLLALYIKLIYLQN